ncbi:MAG: LysR family transcriptional regulator [Ruegeria sp.]
MDWLQFPPLAALRAFTAFVEHGSVVRAGDALNVSHAAISQQLRALEAHMGVALFDRAGKTLNMTPDGEHLARSVQLGFSAIETAVSDIVRAGADRPVHVSLTSSFAASWLMPRLPTFQSEHPDIDLTLDPSPDLVDLRPGGVDVAIRYGVGGWMGVQSEMLLQTPMVIVAAPGLLGSKTDWSAVDLARLPWLEEVGTTEASTWLAERGAVVKHGAGRISLPGNLLLEGVRAGQGVTVTVRHFVERDILSGRLVEIHAEPDARGYHIVMAQTPQRKAVKTFVRWLKRQAGEV